MKHAHYLVIDVGGHGVRALVYDTQGVCQFAQFRAIETLYPAPGWVEHKANDFVAAMRHVLTELCGTMQAQSLTPVAAAIACQRSTVVAWRTEEATPMSQALSWQDVRASDFMRTFENHALLIQSRTGLRVSPHYGVGKIRWIMDHVLTAALRGTEAWRVGPLVSFLMAATLQGHPNLCDPANAGRTLLMNSDTAQWDVDLLKLFAVNIANLPTIVDTHHNFGTFTDWPELPLKLVTGDQSAAAFGTGSALRTGELMINMGTGAFLMTPWNEPAQANSHLDIGLLRSILHKDQEGIKYVLEASVNGAGSALQWLCTLEHRAAAPSYAELVGVRGRAYFMNGVGGLAAPYWSPGFQNEFINATTREEKFCAVYDSILFLMYVNYRRFCSILPPFRTVRLSGGLSQDAELCQALADLFELPMEVYPDHQATARGAAYLLAGRPEAWSIQAAIVYQPQSNPNLRACWARWQGYMDERLSCS